MAELLVRNQLVEYIIDFWALHSRCHLPFTTPPLTAFTIGCLLL